MKANGSIIKQKVMAPFGTLKEISTVVNSKMIWLMVTVNTLTLMAQSTRVNSKMIFKMVMEKKNGLMVLNMWEPTKTESNKCPERIEKQVTKRK